MQLVDRILQMQGRPPLVANPDLNWVMNIGAQITPRTLLPGYSYVRVGDRKLLHQVTLFVPFTPYLIIFKGYKPTAAEKTRWLVDIPTFHWPI